MIDDKRKKKRVSDFEIEEDKKEVDTMDIYDDDQRNEMLKTDEITAAENAFMQGREMKSKEIKKMKKSLHEDSVSVELAQDEYTED
jgi:hypothetical protein